MPSKSKVRNAPRPQALEFNSREPGGRKRHVLVDTLGLLIVVVVTAANLPERAGALVSLPTSQKRTDKILAFDQNLG